jgi:hypothetical protein
MKWLAAILLVVVAGCASPSSQVSQSPNTPGATGRTVVPGSNSTVAGDADATYRQQKWPYGNTR